MIAQPNAAVLRVFWSGALAMIRRVKVRQLLGLRSLPTIFYGMLTVLIPVLLNGLSGNKLVVAAYATTNLIVASVANCRPAVRQIVGGAWSDAGRYTAIILAGLGLAATVNTVWGLFIFGVLGVAAAWSLSTLMYVWVKDGVAQSEHASSFGLLHAVWSLSMITGSLLGGSLVRTFPGLPFLIAGLLNVGSLLPGAGILRPASRMERSIRRRLILFGQCGHEDAAGTGSPRTPSPPRQSALASRPATG